MHLDDTPQSSLSVDTLVVAVLRFDASDRLIAMNTAAAALCGQSRRQARGRSVAELFPADATVSAALDRCRSDQEAVSLREHRLLLGLPPGQPETVMCEITPQDAGGTQLEILPLARFRRIEDENRLLQLNQSRQLFARGLAHEIKNPLGGMKGAAQLLAAELDDADQQEYLDIILRETDRLTRLVDRLMGPPGEPQRHPANIHEVLEQVIALVQLDSGGNLQLVKDYDPSLPDVRIDTEQMTQVFLNLLTNARHALLENDIEQPRVTIVTRIERRLTLRDRHYRQALRIEVRDNGPGIASEIADSLFMPMITSRPAGHGMGLAIAQDIVQRHDGLIEWERRDNQTSFIVLLPVSHQEAES
ncbi:MAG: nitrogen regulation protein NR(II) [Gammaproteobacteria bacterium]|nr:nitrogen regulation protein NR(II) [Gammaproteobacteria bacterium]